MTAPLWNSWGLVRIRDHEITTRQGFPDVCQSKGLKKNGITPGLHCQISLFFAGMPGDGNDSCMSESWHLAKLSYERTAAHVRHSHINEHQIGPKVTRNVECLPPTVGYMRNVAKLFNEQTQ